MSGCGDCTLCCKIMGVKELSKPRNAWCSHIKKGCGCSIYNERPESCREFECIWLQSQKLATGTGLSLELRPDKCKAVLTQTKEDNGIIVHVDPGYPTAWQSGKLKELIDLIIDKGLPVIIAVGKKRQLFCKDKNVEIIDDSEY